VVASKGDGDGDGDGDDDDDDDDDGEGESVWEMGGVDEVLGKENRAFNVSMDCSFGSFLGKVELGEGGGSGGESRACSLSSCSFVVFLIWLVLEAAVVDAFRLLLPFNVFFTDSRDRFGLVVVAREGEFIILLDYDVKADTNTADFVHCQFVAGVDC